MSIPKEPRQLMINLMYLVLTAMLALNVSNEILHAFKIINNSIVKSNESIAGKNNETLVAFDANQEMEGHRDRVKPFNDQAKAVHEHAEAVYKYLEDWKMKIVAEADQVPIGQASIANLKREDNIDASTRLLVENKGGDEIKGKLETLRKFMLDQIKKPETRAAFEKDLPLQITDPGKSEENASGDWSFGTFHNVPTLGAVTLFAKMQNDIRTSETAIIQHLFSEADATQLKFDAIIPVAVPKTSYVLAGQPVEAQIMIAAYNKSANPQIRASSGSVTVQGGVGTWKSTASGTGLQTVRGTVSMNLGDRPYNQPFSFQYMVGSAGASMQLDKMNVFYIGVPNPITVTAAGYSLEDVSINIPGATTTKTANGKYEIQVTPATGQKVIASIMAGGKQVGAMDIRVKRIPDPVAKVAGRTGSVVLAANVFRAQLGIAAALDNFDFDAKFQVTSYQFSYIPRRKELQDFGVVNSPLFSGNPQVLNYIQKQAAIGDRIFIDNIRAKGPDGTTRSLGTISILLN